MNILVLGSGGREHAVVWKLQQNELAETIFTLPGNGGLNNCVDIPIDDFGSIRSFCEENKVELIFVGPEDPLVNGIVDYFSDSDIKVFGPNKKAALLEGSKIFAKQFMRKYGVATADFKEFGKGTENSHDLDAVLKICSGNCVIKYDGLAAGKGVYVCNNETEVRNSISELRVKYGADVAYLIEQKLIGDEISLLAVTDGKNYKLMVPSQDHKQLMDGDYGPNTGGMGTFCPVPFLNKRLLQRILDDIVDPSMKGIIAENFNYKGIIFFGIMITEDGPKLLEYNIRMGDPETEIILPAMSTDFLHLILSCFDGTFNDYHIYFSDEYFVDVVLVSGGYPVSYKKGYEIEGLNDLSDDTLLFHAGTKLKGDKLLTNGGRVLNLVCRDTTLQGALDKVYKEVRKIYFPDVFYRTDIGNRKQ